MHESGAVYLASEWSWRWEDIPYFPSDFVFDDRPTDLAATGSGDPYEFPVVVTAGERHHELFKLLRSCKARGWDSETTREVVTLANRSRCSPPLIEDDVFDKWFARGWNNRDRDRPFVAAPALEPQTTTVDYDLETAREI